MDLVHEKHIPVLKLCKDCCHLSRFLDRRSRRDLHIDTHLVCHDACECRLTKSRRTMIQCITSLLCRFNIDRQIFLNLLLSDIIRQTLRSECRFQLRILRCKFRTDRPFCHSNQPCLSQIRCPAPQDFLLLPLHTAPVTSSLYTAPVTPFLHAVPVTSASTPASKAPPC